MPGMLGQGSQGAPTEPMQPSSGPDTQTPPAEVSPESGAPGPEHSQASFEELRDKAITLVYGERFDQLIKMFQTNGPDQFARSMAITINTALTELEKEGDIGVENAAKIGMDLMMKLFKDMIKGGVVPDVKVEQMQQVLPATLQIYADSHPEVSQQDIQQVMQGIQKGVAEQSGGAQQTGTEPAPANPGASPEGDPASPPAQSVSQPPPVSDDRSAGSGSAQPTNRYEAMT
jgi:hypothetical protein